VIREWIDKWYMLALPAVRTFFPVFAEKRDAERRQPMPSIPEQMDDFYTGYLQSICLCPPA
jgi:hypothetical protein